MLLLMTYQNYSKGMKKTISKETRELYRRSLPHGYQKKIADELGINKVAISQFLAGMSASKRIEDAILKTIGDLQRERNELLKEAGIIK